MPYKPGLFSVQKFWDSRGLWDDCVPGYTARREYAETELKKLTGNATSFRPKYDLMSWFMDAIKALSGDKLEVVMGKIPDSELIPAGGILLTKEQFKEKHTGKRKEVSEEARQSLDDFQRLKTLRDNLPSRVEQPVPTIVPVQEVVEELIPGEIPLVRKSNPRAASPAVVKRVAKKAISPVKGKDAPVLKMVANAHAVGGGEFSSSHLMQMMLERGFRVQFHPVSRIGGKYLLPEGVEVCDSICEGKPEGKCDVLMFYANDAVYKLSSNKDNWERLLDGAARNVMCVNYVMGESWQPWFSQRFHNVGFLNSTKEKSWRGKLEKEKLQVPHTFVLPPPVIVRRFLDTEHDYSRIAFIRHGRIYRKFDEADYSYILKKWKKLVPDAEYWWQPAPDFIKKEYGPDKRHHICQWDQLSLEEFLSKGNLFHYRLPKRMADQGPRVIVEAMAAGIPVIGDARDGALDRVTPETGWLCQTNDDYAKAVQEILDWPKLLELKGRAAKARAQIMFDPQLWCLEMIGC